MPRNRSDFRRLCGHHDHWPVREHVGGVLSVGHAALAGAGAYAQEPYSTNFGVPFAIAIGVGLIVGFSLA